MENFTELLKKLGEKNTISSSPYDTAWIARLKNIEPETSNLALEWICDNQLADGSWGAGFPMYYHDRVICTLSSMLALKYWGRRYEDKLRVEKGLVALDHIIEGAEKGLQDDFSGATVGFEVIVPLLIAEAEQLGIIKQQKEKILGSLSHLREVKLNKLRGIKFSRKITIAHSAEMTGQDKLDLLDVDNLQETNGSVGNSPSATAHFALYVKPGDQKALDYLLPLANSRNGGAPTLSPIEIFERVWVLWNLSLTNLYQENEEIAKLCNIHLDYLEKYWRPGDGIGFSESFTPTDADDTSVGYEILSKFGRKGDLSAVLQFEEEKWFRCFHFEANPSVDVNIHVVGALRQAGFDKTHPSVQKAMNFIHSMKQPGSYWYDKWNVSPFYTTAHLIMQCKEYDIELCREAMDWMLKQQRLDGSWGFFKTSTAEETAYCIQALAVWQNFTGEILTEKIKRAKDWLTRNCEPPYPPLWMDKSLYCPEVLVKSSILSALALAEAQA